MRPGSVVMICSPRQQFCVRMIRRLEQAAEQLRRSVP